MATEAVATTTKPTDVGLKREMGLIGATWASETSIIGSGWLFGALFAVQAAGPAALLGWIIGGVTVIFLALVHAELGGMYPVSGGTARFPHFAFGSVAGISFGFFSWIQAVTVAPIECFAVMQYGSYYWHGLFNATANGGKGNVTGLGFVMTIVLLMIFTALNFLAMRLFSKVNAGITWWKVAIPVVTIIMLLFKFHGGNFTSHGFMPYGIKALFGAIPSAASCSPTSASSRLTSWPRRSRTRRRTCPGPSCWPSGSASSSTSCCRWCSSAPCGPTSSPTGGPGSATPTSSPALSPAWPASSD